MHEASVTPQSLVVRQGSATILADALQASRRDTLITFAAYERALPDLRVPLQATLNPPLWELGHVGWFQSYWLARNPQWQQGAAADPDAPRGAPGRPDADALYDSGRVAHDTRWSLPLPDARETRSELERQLHDTLHLLESAGDGDDALYFFRLALLHEDMHHEAALYMAQSLGIAIDDGRWRAASLPAPAAPITIAPGRWVSGSAPGPGFAFDNELHPHTVELGETVIDAHAVRWAEFLPFVECGAYADDRCWDASGLQWRASQAALMPRYLRRDGAVWQVLRHGRWQPLDRSEAACHLTHHEARAWCQWANRRLPDEAEWERAAITRPDAFRWGDVWEWTASPFASYPGFRPHPYRDYSAPWFDGRPVLRGASRYTQPRMRHPRYRNFFPPHRNDVAAGFRSCAP